LEEDRLLTVIVRLDDFPIHTTERQLEGCNDPLTFDFLRELREPGFYSFQVVVSPSGDSAVETAEFQ
jgi:hypothetical protein